MKKWMPLVFILSFLTFPAISNFNVSFEETFNKWLSHMRVPASVQRAERSYDSTGFLNHFDLLLREEPKAMLEQKIPRNLSVYVGLSLPSPQDGLPLAISLLNKDIQDIPFMWNDWVGKLVIFVAFKKIASTVGMKVKIKKINKENYQAVFLPAKGSQESRYRFDQIVVVYNLKKLILNATLKIYSSADYLPLQFARGEVHAMLRALEQGFFPSATTSWNVPAKLSQGSLSDYLLHETLEMAEEFYNNPEEIEHILPLRAVEEGLELEL